MSETHNYFKERVRGSTEPVISTCQLMRAPKDIAGLDKPR